MSCNVAACTCREPMGDGREDIVVAEEVIESCAELKSSAKEVYKVLKLALKSAGMV